MLRTIIKLILLIFLFCGLSSLYAQSASFSPDSDYYTAKNLAVAGLSVYYSGLSFRVIGALMTFLAMPGIFLDQYKPLILSGFIIHMIGTAADIIAGPVLSIVSYYMLVKNGLFTDTVDKNSLFWYGMSLIGTAVSTTGFCLIIAAMNSEKALIIPGIILLALGITAAVSFKSCSVCIPLVSCRF